MDVQLSREIKVNKISHNFYCDECNKFLGTTDEYEDGYYPTIGDVNVKFRVLKKEYKFKKCLCYDCTKKFVKKFDEAMVFVGFEINKY